jgi:plastocyanin/regulation of enolase protein 1 (concanavalin A-like superfamily)
MVRVDQAISSVSITPVNAAVANGEQQQLFAQARDQFGVQMYTQPTFSWSVDNGFGTIDQAGLYTSPASGLGAGTIRATAPGGVSGTTSVVTQSPAPPDNPANAIAGLEYSYFEGTWSSLPNFDALTPVKTGLTSNLSLAARQVSDHFGFQFNGYVYVPGSGTYTFYTTSDDGSKLWVGGSLVVNNDGQHNAQERSGSIILEAGWHQFKLAYFDSTGNEVLNASYSGPGLASKTAIPDYAFERVDRAPTLITPPSANPSEVTGKTADLSVFGADESGEAALTYTWSTIGKPVGAPDPTFTSNGTNAAKSSTVNFSRAGSYTLQVAISDGTLTTIAQLPVIVDQTLTSLSVSPSSTTVSQNRQAQFSVAAYDQFGAQILTPPQVNWSAQANGGSIDSTGLYTAPAALGTYQITASLGAITASATATVVADNAPTVAQPAQASPNPISDPQSGTTLSALGADDGGEANLTYTWNCTALPGGANFPIFSANGTNASKTTRATFSQPGTYTMLCTISDGEKVATTSVDVQVAVSGPTVASPASASPNPATGTASNLSVLGADSAHGESALTYTWATTGAAPAPVSFSSNGSNASKNVTATFTQAGTYNFQVTISNGSASATSNVTVQVQQIFSNVVISPNGAVVAQGSSRQFSAVGLDQFGIAMSPAVNFAWSISSSGTPGTITQTGLYTAPSNATPIDTITASADGKQASATVTVIAASRPAYGNSDVGSPAIAGSTTFSNGVYTLTGSGADIWNNSDSFHFMYVPLSGDGQIVARVTSMQFQGSTQLRAKAGVMMRDSLSDDARNVMLEISPDNSTTMQQRMAAGSGTGTVLNLGGSAAPFWLKLTRIGDTFTGYRSVDGINWTSFASTTGSMGQTIYVGLAVNSHDDSQVVTSTFDNVSIGTIASSPGSIAGTPLSSRITASSALKPSVLLDGSTSTFFQATSADNAWIGFDFGRPRKIDLIDFAPRDGYAFRINGGRFEASNTRDFKGQVVELYQVRAKGETAAMMSVPVHPPQSFRYVRYVAPKGSFGNLAEAHFYGS